ncbi:MAG: hypothetical protein AAB963_00095 [Patescibacteria group bacterium]
MENEDRETLFWREFDRLIVFTHAWQIDPAFHLALLDHRGFQPEGVETEELLAWAIERRLIIEGKRPTPTAARYHLSLCASNRWNKMLEGQNKHKGRMFFKVPFSDSVVLGQDYETAETIRSAQAEKLSALRLLWPLTRQYFDWLKQQQCLLYDEQTGAVKPTSTTLSDVDVRQAFFALMIDLSVITPIVKSDNGVWLWSVIGKRAREIRKAVENQCFLPEGDALALSNLADIIYGSFYGTKVRVYDKGIAIVAINICVSSRQYRLALRYLSQVDFFNPKADVDFPIEDKRAVGSILEEFCEAGLLEKQYAVYGVLQERIALVLKGVYCPRLIPAMFGALNGSVALEIEHGPNERVDASWKAS